MVSGFRHVVAWKLADPESRDETVAQMKSLLEALVGVVPGLKSLSVNPTALPGEGNWDVVLISDHDSLDAFRTYQTHPAHLEAAQWVSQHVSERAAVDYVLEP